MKKARSKDFSRNFEELSEKNYILTQPRKLGI